MTTKFSRRQFVKALSSGGAAWTLRRTALADDYDVVDMPGQGKLRGVQSASIRSFKGIAYANNPSGALRFRSPTPLPPWPGILDATEYGAPSIQNNRDEAAWRDPKRGDENCLCLNVWTPVPDSRRSKPVMVWFHGGWFSSGSGGVPLYDGSNLARAADVVVVTVNHRLNIFGYLWLGDLLPAYAKDGNLGQQDLVASLRWIRANISVFGGDPNNVTIFGESGGGAKVGSLLATPSARNLFHKAIIESGSQTFIATREEATATTLEALRALKLGHRDAETLLAMAPERLLEASNAVEDARGTLAFQPVMDGYFMPHQTWSSVAPGESIDIPLVIGTNRDEAAAFLPDMRSSIPDDDVLKARFAASVLHPPLSDQQFRELLTKYRTQQPAATRMQLLVAMSTELLFRSSAIHQAELKCVQCGAAVFMYEWAWKTPCFGEAWAIHASEIPFVFGNLRYGTAWDGTDSEGQRAKADPTNRRITLAQQTMAAWAAFAHTGNPSTANIAWPAYDLKHRKTMLLGMNTQIVDDPHRERRLLGHDIRSAW